ncbi:hypothetical protein [Polyangium sorediatum]|uniref:Uncharacterized protein n=1 Tax=Polyangium sorediatum TaxID=889274 RepID=A0ABT6NSR7_9BACT|nr:hypothetical protein [Polyangium sorediatum]MDI1431384.1 hypothetical protein [Polyangium sorediatum]
MALDVKTRVPEARAAFLKDGEWFGSEDTLQQAQDGGWIRASSA